MRFKGWQDNEVMTWEQFKLIWKDWGELNQEVEELKTRLAHLELVTVKSVKVKPE